MRITGRKEEAMGEFPRAAAILAGGRGSRLGGIPKESILVDGEALGPRLVRILGDVFEEIIVITNNRELYAGSTASMAADIVPGFGPLSGLHAALRLARLNGPDDGSSTLVWLMACDMPAFDSRLVDLLARRHAAASERAAKQGARPPLASLALYGDHFEPFQAIYSTALVEELEELFKAEAGSQTPDDRGRRQGRGDESRAIAEGGRLGALGDGRQRGSRQPSFKDLFARVAVEFVAEEEVRKITPDWGLYFNVNTPEELGRLGGVASA